MLNLHQPLLQPPPNPSEPQRGGRGRVSSRLCCHTSGCGSAGSVPRLSCCCRPSRLSRAGGAGSVQHVRLQSPTEAAGQVPAAEGGERREEPQAGGGGGAKGGEAFGAPAESRGAEPGAGRFFGNRSFCHEKLQSHAEALRDAQRALSLRPDWPRGLFRQGKALLGLKQYREAARNFWQLLPLDGFRGDAALQLQKCQAQHSLEGWTDGPHRDWDARPVEMQQLPLPSGQPGRQRRSPDSRAQDVAPTRLAPPAAEVPVRDRFAIWVGNLAPTITPQGLRHYFQPFGPVESVRCLPHKACAFVNYSHQGAAKAAYKALQGAEVEGRRLVLQLKHPTHAPAPLPTAGPPSHHGPSSWA